jgi:hypothetical protein
MNRNFILLALTALFISCNSQKEVDLIVHNAMVYTVDDNFSVVEAFAVKDGKILET